MISLNYELPNSLPITPSAIRILSLYESYGCNYDFLRFYKQEINGDITAIISVMDNNATLCLIDDRDTDEIIKFISAIGAKTVFCEKEITLEKLEQGSIMLFDNIEITNHSKNEVKLSNVYDVMSTCFTMPDFSAWYPDISHRIRHGGAVAVEKEYGCAIALKSSIGALISGICVKENSRNKGHGSVILQGLINTCGSNKIFALVEKNGPKQFYKNNGFFEIGKFATYKVK